MRSDKRKRMMQGYDGHAGSVTVSAVCEQIPEELYNSLTGHQLGIVMSMVNKTYHKGKHDAGAEILDDAVWVSGKLIPLVVIDALQSEKSVETKIRDAEGLSSCTRLCDSEGRQLTEQEHYSSRMINGKGSYYIDRSDVTRWTCDYTERV
jgi:hypothetical protein